MVSTNIRPPFPIGYSIALIYHFIPLLLKTFRPEYVVDKVFDLFAELKATDEQMDFQVVYASGMHGIAGLEPTNLQSDLTPLFDKILNVPQATVDPARPLQLLVANVDYDDFIGKLGIGRVVNGVIKNGDSVSYGKPGEPIKQGKIVDLFVFNNVGREKVDSARAGDIVVVAGLPDIQIGETVMERENVEYLPTIAVEEPTVRMTIGVNKSPLGGREGKLLQTRAIRDRLFKELDTNVALRVQETDSADTYEVCGRGQLHLTVLIENMRREGFELFVGPPSVIDRVVDGVKCEPFELVEITVPQEYAGAVVDILNKRRGEMRLMGPCEGCDGLTSLTFLVPTRGTVLCCSCFCIVLLSSSSSVWLCMQMNSSSVLVVVFVYYYYYFLYSSCIFVLRRLKA
jgi:GTP-binding protein